MYYPLTKEEALAQGFKWDDYETPPPEVSNIIEACDLPDNIKDVGDDILDTAVRCEATGKLFKLTAQELKFYRRRGIPVPRRCQEQRHLDRFYQRNPRKFWDRECGKCGKGIRTTFDPADSKIVYCEDCYMKVLY